MEAVTSRAATRLGLLAKIKTLQTNAEGGDSNPRQIAGKVGAGGAAEEDFSPQVQPRCWATITQNGGRQTRF